MQSTQATVIGFVGVTLLLVAFLLNLLRLMRVDGYAYMTLNFAGALLACYSSYLIAFMPFVVLEGVWSAAAGVALVGALASRGKGTGERVKGCLRSQGESRGIETRVKKRRPVPCPLPPFPFTMQYRLET